MFAILIIALAGGSIAASQIPAGKARLGKVGPAIEKSIANATGGRLDQRNYTYNARGKPVAFNRVY